MRYEPLPTQIAGAEFLAARRRALLADEPRVGKQQPVDSLVMTPKGPVDIGSLAVGDDVCHPSGGIAKVTGVFPQGVQQAYRVTLTDGSSTECGIEHLWSVRDSNAKRRIKRGEPPFLTLTLGQIAERGLLNADGKNKFHLPTHAPAGFEGAEHLVPPYLLGILIGDGSFADGGAVLSVADRDTDIEGRVRSIIPLKQFADHRTGPNCVQVRIAAVDFPIMPELRRLGVACSSLKRRIPVEYLVDNEHNRIELLRGLMDADGHCGLSGDTSPIGVTRQSGCVHFSTKSNGLADDVLWLVRSLGGFASKLEFTRDGEKDYRVNVRTEFCPFHTAFKRNRWSVAKSARPRAIASIEPSRRAEQVCIEVSASDGLYLTDDFIVTHNTGAAIMATDRVAALRTLVVTTVSGKAVWRRAWPNWSRRRQTVALYRAKGWEDADVVIAAWSEVHTISPAVGRRFDLIILDEAHAAKNPAARRTRATYGWLYEGGRTLIASAGFVDPDARAWLLTGTPAPHDLSDLYIHMRASIPERLLAWPDKGWPNVIRHEDFIKRYCIVRPKRLDNGHFIDVIVGGRNEAELKERLGDFILRRTQEDVGIRPPVQELMPISVPATYRKNLNDEKAQKALEKILKAIEDGVPVEDVELGRVRRLTGVVKAEGVAQAAKEDLEGGLPKLVIAYWHKDVGDILQHHLAKYGVVRVDGSTSQKDRELAEMRFNATARVFLAQIVAAGEAIDLSASNELWFAESSFTPKDMKQMSARISNVNQKATTFVKICYIEDSIDEAIQNIVAQLTFTISKVVEN